MLGIILLALLVSLLINCVLFLIAYSLQSDKLTDISYALSFLAIDILFIALSKHHGVYAWTLFLMPFIWAVRIGAFLLIRVFSVGKDRRFDGIRENFIKFGKFWLGQGFTAWVLMLPVIIAGNRNHRISAAVYIGLMIWLVGFLVETASDYQKFAFKKAESNRGKWIQSGLWKYSRHPNYFGEISVWLGIYVASLPSLHGLEKLVAAASPLLIAAVLIFVSGVPILEKSADEKWGEDKEYKEYKRRTRLIIPLPKFN